MNIDDLEIWQEGKKLRKEISDLVKNFPEYEKFKLIDQMIRASRSVTANIAEGYGRYSLKKNLQFCRMARGSLYELYDHLTVAIENNYINSKIYDYFRERIFKLIKMLNSYISHLKILQKKRSDNQATKKPKN